MTKFEKLVLLSLRIILTHIFAATSVANTKELIRQIEDELKDKEPHQEAGWG